MKNYIDPKTLNEAVKSAHVIRSQAAHKTLRNAARSSRGFAANLFTLYNPQIKFRR